MVVATTGGAAGDSAAAEGVVVAVAVAGAADPTVLGGVGVLVAAEAVAEHEDCLALTEFAAAPMRAATRVCGHAGPPARSPRARAK